MTTTTTLHKPAHTLRERSATRVAVLLWCLMSLLVVGRAQAQEFAIRHVETHLQNEVYRLDADIELQLSKAALEALSNGVPLTVEFQIEVLRPRWLLWDERIAALSQRYRFRYHALSQQYMVTNLNTGMQRNFPTRASAARAMGILRDFPMLDRRLLKVGQTYTARLRASLDIESLPSPLRPVAYLSSQWRLKSDWYEWTLQS